MIRFAAVAVVASLVSLPAAAASWVNVTKTNEQSVAVDLESFDPGDVQDVWVLFTSLKPQEGEPATSRQWLRIFCAEGQFTIRYYEAYSSAGQMTASRTLSDPPIAIDPKGVTAEIAKVACPKP